METRRKRTLRAVIGQVTPSGDCRVSCRMPVEIDADGNMFLASGVSLNLSSIGGYLIGWEELDGPCVYIRFGNLSASEGERQKVAIPVSDVRELIDTGLLRNVAWELVCKRAEGEWNQKKLRDRASESGQI